MSGCDQRQFADQGCFIEAAIFDPATSQITLYHPLVVNQGDVAGKDFIKPVPATVPNGATVGIWFGSNGVTLTLQGAGARGCTNGLGNSVFGQFAHCNGDRFMQTGQAAIAAGKITVPPVGTGKAGACPTTRDFRVVDMDQSDNVDTQYLLINNHILAQATPANQKNSTNAQVLSNGSDNALINDILAPILGCIPWAVSSTTAVAGTSPGLALNELQAGKFPPAGGPALVPLNDDMTVINNNGAITQSLQKTNLYRAGVGQPPANTASASGTTYCKNYAQSGIFISQNQALFKGQTSPAPAVAVDLYTFLAQRFSASFGPVPALGCQTIFGLATNPVALTLDGNGVVTAATINTQVLQAIFSGATAAGNGTAAATTTLAAATTVSTAQVTAVLGQHGTRQSRHKGGNNVIGGPPPPPGKRVVRRSL
jgi:hypothetical protein